MSAVSTGTLSTAVVAAPPVLDLRDASACDPSIAGAKAANVARLAAIGLPVLEGFVLTTSGVAAGIDDRGVRSALREHWRFLGGELGTPLVVRSSSTVEDARSSSMAGRFTSVLDVRGWEAFAAAIGEVVESGRRIDAEAPMAVLVQRQLAARRGGVLFGADPVAGRTDRVVIEWVDGRPDQLVGGHTTAAHAELTRRGRLVRPRHDGAGGTAPTPSPPLARAARRRLARVAAATEQAFGGPQDIEWALDAGGALWVLQARPVTALHRLPPRHQRRRLGAGPVAETFPRPLAPLEADLWVGPLREGLVRALRATGTATEHALRSSPVVTTVSGRLVIDLDLIEGSTARGWRRMVSPRRIVRRLATAWRVGRLRAALPTLAAIVAQSVDEHLGSIGRIGSKSDGELVDLLRRSRDELATVHSYEMLAGMLLPPGESVPAPMVAMRALHDARRAGLDDDELVAVAPEVLSLSAPSLDAPVSLPSHDVPASHLAPQGTTIDDLSFRDALRLRLRWLHELQCRAAREIGHRAEMRGTLAETSSIALLSLDEVEALCTSGVVPVDLGSRCRPDTEVALPAEFALADDGAVVPFGGDGDAAPAGTAAGGGRGAGTVVDLAALRAAQSSAGAPSGTGGGRPVLVTEFLDPSLATALPLIAGLVAESGSVLSHLAILARECGIPTVVAVRDARRRFPPGTHVLVDGFTGEVAVVEADSGAERAP